MSSALLIGATGSVGKQLLPLILSSPNFSHVGEFGRRVTSFETPNAKLEQKTIDFEKLPEAGLKDGAWDVVFITLGTTKAIAGSKEAFTKIDKTYVVNAAREARVPGKTQRLVYLSSTSANPSSYIFYSRSKGETEIELAKLGYDDFVVVRPGMFDHPDRSGTSRANEGHGYIVSALMHIMPTIKVPDIAKTILHAGEVGSKGLPKEADATLSSTDPKFTIVENTGMKAWAATLA